ncbi:MAG TPA: neuraminidase-like domain-containing protein, partial [Candidatus Limnocylindrales bacterium]
IATVVAPARQVPLTRTGAELTDTQSRAIVAANLASFEPAGPGRYRLAAGFDPAAALTVPATIDQRFRPLLPDVLAAYHGRRVLLGALPGVLASTPAAVTELAGLLGTDLGSGPLFAELRGDVTVPARLAALIDGLRRLARLFADTAVFDAERLAYVGANAARFGLTSFERPSLAGVRAVERFRSLLSPWVGGDAPVPDLEGVIARFDSATGFVAADRAELARALGCEVGLLRSLDGQVALGPAPLPATERLGRAVDLSKELGTGGALLGLVRSTTYAQLAAASAAVQAAFRAAFADEQAWEKAVEPDLDALLSRRRDGLVADLLRSSPRPFDSTADLYHYYLLDVQLEGCARTSRVAAAIDSVQLYVQRCLLNYEESPPGVADPVHVLPGTIPERAWSWRSHYRVWQAARELFINPESYVLPEQRHDRTHLFKELEETLLSKEVTEDTILDAYSRYLRGFEELAHLTIAGAYHERDDGSGRDTLHLFGVNSADPPVYYYRRVE